MAVPILRQDDLLIASIQSDLTDAEFEALRSRLVEAAGRHGVRGVVVDVSTLDVMDSFATRTLRAMVDMLRLRGAEAVVVGIQPDVAFSMVQLGLTLEGVATALNLDRGLRLLRQRLRRANDHAR